jgi:hypothetical protein
MPPPNFGREGAGNDTKSAHRIVVIARGGDLKVDIGSGKKENTRVTAFKAKL